MDEVVFSPADFVAVLNQTLEFAYPTVSIAGELANFRVSKNKWVYFDLKDENASVKFFGTVYQLPGPLEDGLMLKVRGQPRLHPLYGFSVSVQSSIQPVGEGSLKRAASLLAVKLEAEGLFDPARKRPLPFPPRTVGLVTSGESAAYGDFIKIMNERWGGVEISLADVQVQGEQAPGQIVRAIEYLNSHAAPVEVLVIIRGGGSADDLAAFSTEQVTRAVAASRIPTIVAIGHEADISLAELAADQRASTPSNAAQLLVPDKTDALNRLPRLATEMNRLFEQTIYQHRQLYTEQERTLYETISRIFENARNETNLKRHLLNALNPSAALRRGYAVVRQNGRLIRSAKQLKKDQDLDVQLHDGQIVTAIKDIMSS